MCLQADINSISFQVNLFDYFVCLYVKKKEKKRGFNQSEEFGRGLSESMGKPLQINNLVRITPSETQTRKSRFRRWENVADIFHVDTPAGIENKKVLLVDDVVTTGATLESCAIALMNKCPGIEIKIATIAFATQHYKAD